MHFFFIFSYFVGPAWLNRGANLFSFYLFLQTITTKLVDTGRRLPTSHAKRATHSYQRMYSNLTLLRGIR